MVFENGVKNIQAAAYNGMRTVCKMEGRFLNFYITNKSMAGNLLICYMKN